MSFCSIETARTMNHWCHPPEPLDDSFTSWLDTPHYNNNGIAAIEYRFNPNKKLYEWVRTGELQKPERGKGKMFEGSINRVGNLRVDAFP